MKFINIILLVVVILSSCASSRADSIAISFEDGKTQTMQLDQPIKSITAIQYLSADDKSLSGPVSAVPKTNTAASTPPQETKQTKQQANPTKPLVKFKWADPMVGQ